MPAGASRRPAQAGRPLLRRLRPAPAHLTRFEPSDSAGDLRELPHPWSMGSGRPAATATIDPMGQRGVDPRDHRITITIPLDASTGDQRHAERGAVAGAARRSLGACLPAVPAERLDVRELTHRKRNAGDSARAVVGVEASAITAGRPSPEDVDRLRAILTEDGYAVAVRERRECTEAPCGAEAAVDWNRPEHVPSGWFSAIICGR